MKKATFPAVVSTFVLCMIFWLLITGSLDMQELIVGAVVSLFVAIFSARFLIRDHAFWLWNPAKFFPMLVYCVIIFPWELIKANCNMVKLVFGPKSALKPGIVKVPVAVSSDYGRAMLANSITLTPGTITLETNVEPDGQGYFYVHWMETTETDRCKAGDAIKGTLEKWVGRIWK